MWLADRLAPSDRRKNGSGGRERIKAGKRMRPNDRALETGSPAVCLGNPGPTGKRGLDRWLGVWHVLVSPVAPARPQNPRGNNSSRCHREAGPKKSRGGTQGLAVNRAPGEPWDGGLFYKPQRRATMRTRPILTGARKMTQGPQPKQGGICASSQSLAGQSSSATGNNQGWFQFPSGGGCQDGALSQKEPGIQLHVL